MRRALWVAAWIGVAVWSLFAWGAYGLFGFFGDIAAYNAAHVTNHPETAEWLSWAVVTLRGLGLAAILFVWGLVSLLMLAVPLVAGLILGRLRSAHRHPDWRVHDRSPGAVGEAPSASDNPARRQIEKR